MQQSRPETLARAPAAQSNRPAAGHQSVTSAGGATSARPAHAGAATPVDATLLRCLQRAVEDRAVARDVQQLREGSAGGGLLQRRVTVGTKLYNIREKLPPFPPTMAARYHAHAIAAVTAIVEGWRDDGIIASRTWTDTSRLYQAAIDEFLTEGSAAATVSTSAPWSRLAFAVHREDANGLVEMPWASFGAAAAALEDELKKCKVQISSNPDTTACHGNSHRKLPKKVITPTNVPLDEVEIKQQPLYTPYYEFLIPGHKSENEIERGILDRNSRQVYITAHYETGSFVWLSGAPKALLDNWVQKASKYRQDLIKG